MPMQMSSTQKLPLSSSEAGRNGDRSGPGDRIHSRATTGLFVLGVFYTAYFARDVLIPVTMALLLNLVLAPAVRAMNRRLHIPQVIGAAAAVVGLSGVLVVAFYAVAAPAADWMHRLPQEIVAIEDKLQPLHSSIREVKKAAEKVEGLARNRGQDEVIPTPVVLDGPSLTELLLGQTTTVSIGLGMTLVLLLFLLASGDTILRQAVTAAPNLHDKRVVVEVVRETEQDISHYLVAIAAINTGLGIAIGTAMWLLDMPNPALWGVMAGLFNFVPYVGGLVGVTIVALVAIVTFDSAVAMALPPLAYLVINAIEGQLVTPALLAHRLVLNPVAVLLSLIVWSWMWGIPGTLMAVPLLATFKIVCDHVGWLEPVGILLGRPKPPEDADGANGPRR